MGNRLVDRFGCPRAVYEAPKSKLMTVPGIGHKLADNIREARSLTNARKLLDVICKTNTKILTRQNDLYPECLRTLQNTPLVLYYKGTLKNTEGGVTIIGSRRCTSYAKQVVSEAARFLAVQGIPVIGGLSKGVEGYAHTACLKSGGYTLAILGHDLDICYPKEHRELMDVIETEGAIISQFLPGTAPHPANFLKRNHLMIAWTQKTLLVEASQKSAALKTAEYAKRINRLLYAVPNSIYNRESKGTNGLIQEGAQIYLGPSQLLSGSSIISGPKPCRDRVEDEPVKPSSTQPDPETSNTPLEMRILELLGDSRFRVEHLAQKLDLHRTDILEIISTMHVDGKVTVLPGGFIRRGGTRV